MFASDSASHVKKKSCCGLESMMFASEGANQVEEKSYCGRKA